MRLVESGRFVHRAGAVLPRRYAERNLLTIHGRAARLRAIVRGGRLRSTERDAGAMSEPVRAALDLPCARNADWLLLRDYDDASRGRSVLFFFAESDDVPLAVVKVRRRDAAGEPLAREAEVLRALATVLPTHLRTSLPRVEGATSTTTYELLVLSGLAGRSLGVSMQRSLRPRSAHAQHLEEAGRWLGTLHAATRHGGRTAVHGDFWPRNVLFASSRLTGVIDWELGSLDGEPWLDLFTMPLVHATAAPSWRRLDRLAEFTRSFTGPGGTDVRRYFAAYSAISGIRHEELRARFEQYLARHAGKEERGWHSAWPWPAMHEAMRSASRSVFSG